MQRTNSNDVDAVMASSLSNNQVTANSLVDGNAAIISGANGEFHGYTNYVASTCPTTLINLPRECKIEIFKSMKVEQLAILCAAHPSFIDSCMHCFECYRKAEYSVTATSKNDLEWRPFLLVLKYFGPFIKILSFHFNALFEYPGGMLILELMARYCGGNLNSVILRNLIIDFIIVPPYLKLEILNLMVNVREWNFSSSKFINSAILFERCAPTIESLELNGTQMDKRTRSVFVQHYPNLSELHLDTKSPAATKEFLMLNSHVKTLILGRRFDYEWLDGHRVEKLTVHVDSSLRLDRLPNVNFLIFDMYDPTDIIKSWAKPAFINGLKMSPNLHTIAFDARCETCFDFLSIILDLIFNFSNVRVLKFKNVHLLKKDVTKMPNMHRTIFKNRSATYSIAMMNGWGYDWSPIDGPNHEHEHSTFKINIVECRNRLMTRSVQC